MNKKVYVTFLRNIWMKRKIDLFINMNIKLNLNFFSINILKFQPRT